MKRDYPFWQRHCHLSPADLYALYPTALSSSDSWRRVVRAAKKLYPEISWRYDSRAQMPGEAPPGKRPKHIIPREAHQVETEITVSLSDMHIPFHDPDAISCAFGFVRDIRPNRLILNGDIPDFYQLSRFLKSPRRILSMQDDIDQTNVILDDLDAVLPDECEKDWILGNHEDRLRRWRWDNPETSTVHGTSFEEMFHTAERGYAIHAPKGRSASTKIGVVEVGHFNKALKYSGATEHALVEERGCSIVQGHSHRMGVYYTRKGGSGIQLVGVGNGCLCDLHPEYVNEPNWHHGLVVITRIIGANRFHIQQYEILGGNMFVDGKRY